MSWELVFWIIALLVVGSVVLRLAGNAARQALVWGAGLLMLAMLLRHVSDVVGLVTSSADTLWPVVRRGVENAVQNFAQLMQTLINAL